MPSNHLITSLLLFWEQRGNIFNRFPHTLVYAQFADRSQESIHAAG